MNYLRKIIALLVIFITSIEINLKNNEKKKS